MAELDAELSKAQAVMNTLKAPLAKAFTFYRHVEFPHVLYIFIIIIII